ncbi:MAG: hypothetical protein IJL86_02900 [Bacteroidales bacterium]|nr:hypothetical protein [Bacteroidales bacterium]
MAKKRTKYAAPQCELCDARWKELLCASVEDGAIENVEFEDWVISE